MRHVLSCLAFIASSLPALADGYVLVCDYKAETCTVETARIYFVVKTENNLPTACALAAMSKTAEVSAMLGPTEAIRLVCGR